jgi:hypothetical protein
MRVVELIINVSAAPGGGSEGNPCVYGVEARLDTSDDYILPKVNGEARFDVDALRAERAGPDPGAYGERLARSLFADKEILRVFRDARSAAKHLRAYLRIRLIISPALAELHALWWESLHDPVRPRASLLDRGHVLFSRHIESDRDHWSEELKPKNARRALIVIADPNPRDEMGTWNLAPIPVQDWLNTFLSIFGNAIPHVALAQRGQATMENLVLNLQAGENRREPFDILFLICHGAMVEGRPFLFLENKDGNVDRRSGADLVNGLSRLKVRPRLVVLCSCDSAGPADPAAGASGPPGRDWEMLAAVGPQMAAEGVPAVVAMHGRVPISSAKTFLAAFFRSLLANNLIDRAMSAGRAALMAANDPHHHDPVLFMRIKSGRLGFYKPDAIRSRFPNWSGVLDSIRSGGCTPIVGPGITEQLLGPRGNLARRWADLIAFPLDKHQRKDLAQIAQFLAMTQSTSSPSVQYCKLLCAEIERRHGDLLTDGVRRRYQETIQPKAVKTPEWPLFETMLADAWRARRAPVPSDPHDILARFPFPIFLTTNPDNLLELALGAVGGKSPRVMHFDWQDDREPRGGNPYGDPGYRPSEHEPLVYHVFGRASKGQCIPVSEDDYFAYLIGLGAARARSGVIPSDVLEALADRMVLFLGFTLEDWTFRVLFRSIVQERYASRWYRHQHLAVQIHPDAARGRSPRAVRDYLKKYFENDKVFVYWGSASDFTRELWDVL